MLHLVKFAKGEGLDSTKTFKRGCWEWERAGDFFQGVCNKKKKKLRSEIFNDKKSL